MLILSGLKVKNSLKIKTTNYDWNDIVYIYDIDVKLIKVIKRESRIGVDIYYIRYMFDSEYETHSIKPLYLVINHIFGHREKIKGSSDRYFVVNINNEKIINVFDKIWRLLNKELLLMEYRNLLKMKLFLIMQIIK